VESEALKAELKKARGLLAIASVIGGATDLIEAFRLISKELAALSGAETVSAYVLDHAGAELRPMAGYHIPREALPVLGTATLPLGEQGFAATVFDAARPVWSDDVQHDPRFSWHLFREYPHVSGLVIPLLLDGVVSGAFYLVWWKERRTWTADELAVLEGIGRQVGLLLRNVRLREALDVRATRLATLLRVSRVVSSSLDTVEVLGEVARAAAEIMNARLAHVWVLDDAGANLALMATSDPEVSRDFGMSVAGVSEGAIGRAVQQREMVGFPDVFASGSPVLQPDWWKRHGLSSLLSVPIIHDAHGTLPPVVVGVLALHGTKPFSLTPDDQALLDGFVAQAAIALANARSYELQGRLLVQTRQQQREALALETTAREIASSLAERELFARITERARELTGADIAFLATRDDAGGARVVAASGARTQAMVKLALRTDVGVGRRVFGDGDVVVVDNVAMLAPDETEAARREGLVALALMPLKVRDAVAGVLGAGNRRGKGFAPAQQAVLARLADQSAIAIHNVRLYDEQRRRGTRLEALSRVTRSMARSLDSTVVLQAIAQALPDLLPDAACRLWVVQDDRIVLGAEAGLDTARAPGVTSFARGEGLVGRAVERGETIVVPDIAGSGATNIEWFQNHGFVSAAVVPLVGERCVGAMAVISRTAREFPEADLVVLRAFAEHAAIAVKKAELYRSVEARGRLIQRLLTMTTQMQQSLDVEAALASFVREAPSAIGFDRVNVFLANPAGDTLTLAAGTQLGARRSFPVADGGALSLAWSTREMVLVNDDVTLARLPRLATALADDPILRTRRFAVVPLLFRGEPIGLVTADNKPSRRTLTEAIVTALELFCQPLAQAINNARLYAETQHHAHGDRRPLDYNRTT
jgi:GAF domain-containing protein